ncbi:hypothetical protein [Elongatibacter sediminis]|uniref:Uncharacterized protein n=1 Tax=Elongatibacter sediminis TaxID=3119006 RepID=A0AAW9REP2_9GAMM
MTEPGFEREAAIVSAVAQASGSRLGGRDDGCEGHYPVVPDANLSPVIPDANLTPVIPDANLLPVIPDVAQRRSGIHPAHNPTPRQTHGSRLGGRDDGTEAR